MGCDTICDLPDSLLTKILLNLRTKDSVKTSVLSTRWRNLWLSVPGLDLATYHCPCKEVLARFMDRFMEFNQGSSLQSFKIWHEQYYYGDHDGYRDRLMELIGTVVNRGIQHLDVSMNIWHKDDFMRQNIYKSKTLVSLKLTNVVLKNSEFVVSLPCLKIMHLSNICDEKDGPWIVEKIISGCPVLEDLELIRPFDSLNEKLLLFLRVSSQTLKICCLGFGISRGGTNFTVEIDAPRLEYLSLLNSQSDRIVVKNLSSLLMIKFNFSYGSHLQTEDLRKRSIFCKLLTKISSTVRRMMICERTLEVLYWYSKFGPIPKFHNLYHLQVLFFSSSFQLLTAFLESCPNLKNIILDYSVTTKPEQTDLTNVPWCLTSTLEYVEIRELIMMKEDETGIIKLVNYFLENSAVLKKLTFSWTYSFMTNQPRDCYKKLLTSKKLSPKCQVIID